MHRKPQHLIYTYKTATQNSTVKTIKFSEDQMQFRNYAAITLLLLFNKSNKIDTHKKSSQFTRRTTLGTKILLQYICTLCPEKSEPSLQLLSIKIFHIQNKQYY